ncbi:MAG TPA: class I SAM-dependent methyltransferase [Pilimelia sp.]|nr:class I SAM-dependent methyltransferase [Pilimelia sp.]
MTALSEPVVIDEQRRDALAERLFNAAVVGAELLTVELGRRLGLYAAVHEHGPLTAAQLASHAGIAERYAREWLEQQAATGFLDVDGASFTLPAAYVPVLLVEDDPAHLIATAPLLTALAGSLPAVADAYRRGDGVPYEDFGADLRHGIAALNRPAFANDLAGWLAAVPGAADRLQAGGRVLDLGCGVGWSSIAIAGSFPTARVHGVDMDANSIADARRNAARAGLADRVTFATANAADLAGADSYDLVCVFEALHDMGEPVKALKAARSVLADGGSVLVADERVNDTFTTQADEVERLSYAFSVLHCLPATMAESTAVANGTVLRAPTVRDWAHEAGFSRVEVLPIENLFWRFYRLAG